MVIITLKVSLKNTKTVVLTLLNYLVNVPKTKSE